MKKLLLACFFILVLPFISCAESKNENKILNFFSMKDSYPPVLQEAYMGDESTVILVFNEIIYPISDSFLSEYDVYSENNYIFVGINSAVDAGKEFNLSGSASDSSGNTVSFNLNIWGYNPNPAKVVINEFTTKGSEKQPDRTELLVLKGGSTAGITVYDGIPQNYRSRVILSDISVKKGDYIVIWWNEKETENVTSSSVYNFSAESTGLSDNNGIITVFSSPSLNPEIVDCVVYSSFSSTQFGGFGTKAVYERVEYALSNAWWVGDAVNSSKSTSTRSMSRKINSEDTDTESEWYTTVSSGITFGSDNTSAEFN